MLKGTIVKTTKGKVGEIVIPLQYFVYLPQDSDTPLSVSKEWYEKAQANGYRFKEEQPYVLLGTKEIQIHQNQLEILPFVRIQMKKESILLPQEDAQTVLEVFKRNNIPYSLS